MIAFNEEKHTYKHLTNGKFYTSVSHLIGLFKPKFNEAYWSVYTAIRLLKGMEKKDFSKYLMQKHNFRFGEEKMSVLYLIAQAEGILQQVVAKTPNVQDEWHTIRDEACERGTALHVAKEEQAYEAGYMKTNPKDINNNVKKIVNSEAINSTTIADKSVLTTPNTLKVSCKELYLLPDGYYPELIIWNDKYSICGTADKVWINTVDGIRFIDIDDWKTNKEIKMPDRYCMEMPLQHLSNVNYIHYTLQISIYAWMLEQVGFKVRNLYLTHQRVLDGPQTRYRLDYLKKEVKTMMEWKDKK